MIRAARLSDVPDLIKMGHDMFLESPRYAPRMQYAPAKVARIISGLITSPMGFVVVAEDQGEIIGAAMAAVDTEWFSDDLVAQELALYVKKPRRNREHASELIRAMKDWAAQVQVVYLQGGVSSGLRPEQVISLYEKEGFTRAAIGVELVFKRGE